MVLVQIYYYQWLGDTSAYYWERHSVIPQKFFYFLFLRYAVLNYDITELWKWDHIDVGASWRNLIEDNQNHMGISAVL